MLTRPGFWLALGVNLLPLIGVGWFGWDVTTLVLLYWFETGIIGFWTCVRIAFGRDEDSPTGPAMALFMVFHAGLFMIVHLILLESLLFDHTFDVSPAGQVAFLSDFALHSSAFIPLVAFVVVRGIEAIVAWHGRVPLSQVTTGLYVRIVVMQCTILIGGWVSLLFQQHGLLFLLVAIKFAAEIVINAVDLSAFRTAKRPA